MDIKKQKQIFAGLVIIGIGSLVAGGVIPLFFNSISLGTVAYFDVDNPTDINDCYATVFTIGLDQKCLVTLSNTLDTDITADITVDLMFLDYETYSNAIEASSNPSTIRASATIPIDFIRIELKYPANPTILVVNDIDNLAEGTTLNLEFSGDGDGSDIYSRPGTYVLVVWVVLDGAASTSVGLSVNVEGIGALINTICSWIGWISLAAAAIFALAYFIKNRKR